MEGEGPARLQVFDAAGRLVRTILDEHRSPGGYVEAWDGRDGSGRQLAAGTYFYRLEAGGYREAKRMMLVK